MNPMKYYSLSGDGKPQDLGFVPADAAYTTVWLDSAVVPDCMFGQVTWLRDNCSRPGLIKHDSDALLMFVGNDLEKPEELNATVKIQIENDILTLRETCYVFVPAGKAYGNIVVENMEKPLYYYAAHLNASDYKAEPAQATEPAGLYANHYVERYEPVDGFRPGAPEGFLELLLWIDGKKLAGAPYMECVWFKTTNDTGPEYHVHDFDEIIGFVGADPWDPDNLGAQVDFVLGDETISIEKSCLFYIPRGVGHSPITVPKMDRPIYHFSGGNGGDYVKK